MIRIDRSEVPAILATIPKGRIFSVEFLRKDGSASGKRTCRKQFDFIQGTGKAAHWPIDGSDGFATSKNGFKLVGQWIYSQAERKHVFKNPISFHPDNVTYLKCNGTEYVVR